VDRGGAAAPPSPRRRHLLTRIVLPALLLAGFGVLVVYAARETLSPPKPVTVIPVILSQTGASTPTDTPLFRAAGWVEPRPTPTLVTALSEGVVEALLVVEGQEVRQGEVVARLVAADARLALDAAEADVKLREAERASANAALTAARARLEQPLHLRTELADAEAMLARTETELTTVPLRLKAAQAQFQFARADWESKQKILSAVSEIVVVKARSDMDAAAAAADELQARLKRLPIEVAALKEKRDAVRQKMDSKIDEVRQVAEGEAAVLSAEARLKQATVARDTARLRLERMDIRAPAAGRVLALIARPGMRLNGLNPGSLHDSSTVVTLYDPRKLQLRVDVRLDDVTKVQSGQKVRVETAVVSGKALDGEVLMATSQADVQKNTLAVKVAVSEPPAALKPDMLCQVTFLALPRPPDATPGRDEPYRLLAPRNLIDSSPDGARVWVADRLSGTARLRRVEVGPAVGELVPVLSGLDPSDKLIVGGRDGLADGARIAVVGEDETLGVVRGKP
jgi:HlyD family secretion protein